MKILIVDDEIDTLNSLENILKPAHYDCQFTISPLEAISLCQTDDFDLIITDLRMEEMNGLDLIKKIRKNNQKIKIIVVSAFCDHQAIITLMDYHIVYIFKKPINVRDFINAIREIAREKTKKGHSS